MARHLLNDDVFAVKETDLELDIKPDAEAVYYLRPLTVEVVRQASKDHTTVTFSRRTHKREEETDHLAVNNALVDYAITRWEGVRNGADPAPCDLAHKLKLPIDVQRALIERAQVGQTAADQEASFRQPAPVRPVLGG